MEVSLDSSRQFDSRVGDAGNKGEQHLSGIIEYLTIALLILSYNTVWTRTPDVYSYASWIKLLACLVASIIPLWLTLRHPSAKLSVGYFAVSGLGFCASFFVGHNLESSIIAFVPVLLGLLYADSMYDVCRLRTFLSRFVNVVCVLAGISLFFFVFGSVLAFVAPTGSVSFNWETDRVTRSFYSLYYEAQAINFFGYSGARNTGVFTEAPMFNFVLCLALLSNTVFTKGNAAKSILLVATILSTFSTTGYFVIALVVVHALFLSKSNSKIISALKYISIPIVVGVGIYALFLLFGTKSDTGSYGVRSDHLIGCVNLFFSTFPFGTGFGNDDAFYAVFSYDQGLSIGVMYLLAQGGIFSLILYGGPTVSALIAALRSRNFSYLLFQLAFFWLVFLTQVTTQPMFWIFVFLLAKYQYLSTDADRAD
ncbi:MAG: hypothetical protein LKH29_02100 [Eggerthellaceae bacterium]|jgi:hypothetical protein|nr:hypothetical protein [Eggerthellaceae bacterium]